jgi:hypothetical protein
MIVLMVAAPLFALSSYVQGRLALSWREVSACIRTLNCNRSAHVDVKRVRDAREYIWFLVIHRWLDVLSLWRFTLYVTLHSFADKCCCDCTYIHAHYTTSANSGLQSTYVKSILLIRASLH